MMNIKVLPCILFLAFILGCKKTQDVNGVVLITVKYNGQYMPNTTVYMKKGAISNPSIALSAYDQNNGTNSSGQVYFEDLPENKYYFYVKTKFGPDTISGGSAATVEMKPRPNMYDITITLVK